MALLPDVSTDEAPVAWELDDHTRELGRRGLAAARQALHQASARLAA